MRRCTGHKGYGLKRSEVVRSLGGVRKVRRVEGLVGLCGSGRGGGGRGGRDRKDCEGVREGL